MAVGMGIRWDVSDISRPLLVVEFLSLSSSSRCRGPLVVSSSRCRVPPVVELLSLLSYCKKGVISSSCFRGLLLELLFGILGGTPGVLEDEDAMVILLL